MNYFLLLLSMYSALYLQAQDENEQTVKRETIISQITQQALAYNYKEIEKTSALPNISIVTRQDINNLIIRITPKTTLKDQIKKAGEVLFGIPVAILGMWGIASTVSPLPGLHKFFDEDHYEDSRLAEHIRNVTTGICATTVSSLYWYRVLRSSPQQKTVALLKKLSHQLPA